jgi:hypothetical protein
MDNKNIITAPNVYDTADVFAKWRNNNVGNEATFFEFMTTPSLERDEFVAGMPTEETFVGSVVSVTIKTS